MPCHINKTSFKKGFKPWHAGTKGIMKNGFRKGHKLGIDNKYCVGRIPWNKGKNVQTNTGKTHFKKGKVFGKNNPNWKNGISKTREYIRFYKSRYKFNKKNAEGSCTFGEWELLKKQYGFKCPSCGKYEPEIKLTIDHIIPLSKGGSNYIENIQPLCGNCNSKKNTKIIKYINVT